MNSVKNNYKAYIYDVLKSKRELKLQPFCVLYGSFRVKKNRLVGESPKRVFAKEIA